PRPSPERTRRNSRVCSPRRRSLAPAGRRRCRATQIEGRSPPGRETGSKNRHTRTERTPLQPGTTCEPSSDPPPPAHSSPQKKGQRNTEEQRARECAERHIRTGIEGRQRSAGKEYEE